MDFTTETERSNWLYRGEGNSSLVVAHLQERKVLRLRKCSTDGSTNKQEANRRDWVMCKDYIDNVMRPLLGGTYVFSPELVDLAPDFVSKMNEDCFETRPKKRLHAHADKDVLFGMVLPDACLLPKVVQSNPNPTFCVEIKCKQGFLPPYSTEKSWPNKPVCRFCMLQQLKVKKSTLNHLSKFCPLDIFSGNHDRMKLALCNVLETPQNNIKIFKDGSLIFSCQDGNPSTLQDLQQLIQELKSLAGGEAVITDVNSIGGCLQSHQVSVMNDVIVRSLLHVPSRAASKQQSGYTKMDVCSASSSCSTPGLHSGGGLPAGCVLQAVLSVQHLDTDGIYSIHKHYTRLTDYLRDNPHHRKYLIIDGPYPPDYLTATGHSPDLNSHFPDGLAAGLPNHLKNSQLMDQQSCLYPQNTIDSDIPADIQECLQRVKSFLVAGTSKDLSIMIAFQRIPDDISLPGGNILNSFGRKYHHSVKIVDLDPKPSSRIPRYVTLEDEIWDNYKYEEG